MRRVLAVWFGALAAYVVFAKGRPEANLHPAIRNGGGHWY